MRFYITPLNEEILGKLILSTFNFTVITWINYYLLILSNILII
jgi:hypothetical protein